MAEVRLGIDVVERRCEVNFLHQRPPTTPNRNFSSTMRRFEIALNARGGAGDCANNARQIAFDVIAGGLLGNLRRSISKFTNSSDLLLDRMDQ